MRGRLWTWTLLHSVSAWQHIHLIDLPKTNFIKTFFSEYVIITYLRWSLRFFCACDTGWSLFVTDVLICFQQLLTREGSLSEIGHRKKKLHVMWLNQSTSLAKLRSSLSNKKTLECSLKETVARKLTQSVCCHMATPWLIAHLSWN